MQNIHSLVEKQISKFRSKASLRHTTILHLVTEVDVHGLDVSVAATERKYPATRRNSGDVLRQSVFTQFTTDTRLFEPTEWHVCVQLVNAVDLKYMVSIYPSRQRTRERTQAVPAWRR